MIEPEQHAMLSPAGWGFLHLNPSVCVGRHDYLPVCWSLRLWYQGDSCPMLVLIITCCTRLQQSTMIGVLLNERSGLTKTK
jgi:hypothetical protein